MALGRIVTHWDDIIGSKMAACAQPQKIHYKKHKSKRTKPEAVLEIAASSADCTILQMQKDLILQRLNLVFGDQWITDIKFVHVTPKMNKSDVKPRKSETLCAENQKNLEDMLAQIEDPDVKERLLSFGTAFLKDKSSI